MFNNFNNFLFNYYFTLLWIWTPLHIRIFSLFSLSMSKTDDAHCKALHMMNSTNTLMMTNVLHNLPTSMHHAYVCSPGSQGYHGLKDASERCTWKYVCG